MLQRLWKSHPNLTVFLVYGFAVAVLFGPFVDNPFIMDDEIQILGNHHIQNFENWSSYFRSSTMGAGGAAEMGGIYYKPLMTTYFAVVWAVAGSDPAAYRIPLFVLFALSGFFVYLFSRRYFEVRVAFFLGLIFLLHPVNAEVAFYIADAQDVMYMFFGLAALSLAALRERPSKIALFFLLMASTLSKETGALFLAILPLYAWFLERHKLKPLLTAAVTAGALYAFMRLRTDLPVLHFRSDLIFHQADLLERLKMLPGILSHYIEIFFFPWRLTLATDFRFAGFNWTGFWLPLAVLVFFLAVVNAKFKALTSDAKPAAYFFLSVLGLWFVLHGQTAVPLDGVYADRWFYLATWSLLSFFFLEFRASGGDRKLYTAVAALLVLACAGRIVLRGLDWQDPLRLYAREFRLNPENAVMVNNVGVILFREGKPGEAKAYFQKATELNPGWHVGWNNFGAVIENEGQLASALDIYKKSMMLADYSQAYENYARLLIRMGRGAEAVDFARREGLPRFPHNPVLQSISRSRP